MAVFTKIGAGVLGGVEHITKEGVRGGREEKGESEGEGREMNGNERVEGGRVTKGRSEGEDRGS